MAWRCRCTLLLDSPVRSAKLRMLCWPYSRIALKMTILLAHNPMGSVRALKGGCNWKNQLFRVRDRPPVVPLYVDAPAAYSNNGTGLRYMCHQEKNVSGGPRCQSLVGGPLDK